MSGNNTQLITTNHIDFATRLLSEFESRPDNRSIVIRRDDAYALFPHMPVDPSRVRCVVEEEEIEITFNSESVRSLPYKYRKSRYQR